MVMTDEPAPRPPALTIQMGPAKLTGSWAAVALVFLLGGIAALLVWMRPSIRMLLTAALWITFIVYWSAAAKNAAPTQSAESPASRALHSSLMNVALLLLFLPVPGLRGRWLPLTSLVVAFGLTVQSLSFLLAASARRHLGRNWSGAIAAVQDHQLVRTGPYRLVRHPIYSAMLGMFVGTAIVSGELHALVALAILVAAYWRKIRLEDRHLGEVFGPEFEANCRDTRALIPYLF